jgi:hypothetical protein
MGFLLIALALTLPILGLSHPNSHSLLHSLGKRVEHLTIHVVATMDIPVIHPRSMGVVVAQVQVIAATPVHIAALAASRPTPPVGALVDPRSPARRCQLYCIECRHVHSPGLVGLYKLHFPARRPNCQRLNHQRHEGPRWTNHESNEECRSIDLCRKHPLRQHARH